MSVMVLVAPLKQKRQRCRNLFIVPSGVGKVPRSKILAFTTALNTEQLGIGSKWSQKV